MDQLDCVAEPPLRTAGRPFRAAHAGPNDLYAIAAEEEPFAVGIAAATIRGQLDSCARAGCVTRRSH
ncbi:MAG: hypothetical protein HGA45_17125 [Chloroflexales bacterium]|nr:hypothetical protein [Chloroflexales bacterium]